MTLQRLAEVVEALEIKSYPSSKEVFDWVVPPEWNVNDAYIENVHGDRIVDVKENNLHLVSYSTPFTGTLTKEELLPHLHTLPHHPTWIPYRTSYYEHTWGFCCPHELLESEKFVGPFNVVVDTELNYEGNLIYGEAFKEGSKQEEILISTYMCHPSLANDNLSGLVTAALLFRHISQLNNRFSYRLAVVPETIGAMCFLDRHHDIKCILGGTVVTTTAGPGKVSIKESFNKEHWVNKAAHLALDMVTSGNYITYPFVPDGSDERQYSSPAFRINTPSIHKSKYYEYDEYHTSADDLTYISVAGLAETLNVYLKWFEIVDSYCFPRRIENRGEYNLGRHGLYPKLGGTLNQAAHSDNKSGFSGRRFSSGGSLEVTGKHIDCFHWLMHLSDGTVSNIDMALRSGLSIDVINQSIALLNEKGLIIT